MNNPPAAAACLALGQRAGVASGLLGRLCGLGQLCYWLPDWPVTKDALPL